MIPLFAGAHLSFLADLLGFPLNTIRRIHRSAGLMAVALLLFHALVLVSDRTSFSLKVPEHLYGLIVRHPSPLAFNITDFPQAGSSLCLLLLLSHPLVRRPSYEIFLRTHQALAALSAYAGWRHLPSGSLFPRMYIYISAALFLSMLIAQCGSVLWRSGTMRCGFARAVVMPAYGTIKVSIKLSRPLKVEAGQYINLWILSVSFWSFLQSHPFVVTSWVHEKQDTLELFVEPCCGWMRELLSCAQAGESGRVFGSRWALFSGPHGPSAPVGRYESVLMIASGLGMAAQLPYLKQLIHRYQTCKVITCRIRVVWQVEHIGKHPSGRSID